MIEEYRPGSADIYVLTELFLDVYHNEPWRYDWMTYGNVRRYFTDLEATPCFLGMKYVANGVLIGFCVGITSDYFVGKTYEIKEILVKRELQGKGAGSYMLAEIEQYLAAAGVGTITLATRHEIDAFQFYIKNGFEVSEGAVYLSKKLLL